MTVFKLKWFHFSDIRDLAKAAVSGDERALDLLSYRGAQGVKLTGFGPAESMTFLLGTSDGNFFAISSVFVF